MVVNCYYYYYYYYYYFYRNYDYYYYYFSWKLSATTYLDGSNKGRV